MKPDELEAITFDTREQSDLWVQIRELGREFEDALSALLFSSTLGRLTRTYGLL